MSSSEQTVLTSSFWLIGFRPATLQNFNFMDVPVALWIQDQSVVRGEEGLIEELPEGETHIHVLVLLSRRAEGRGMCQKILTFGFVPLFGVGITMPEVTTKFPSEDCGILATIFSGSVFSRSKKRDITERSVWGEGRQIHQWGWLYSWGGGICSSQIP